MHMPRGVDIHMMLIKETPERGDRGFDDVFDRRACRTSIPTALLLRSTTLKVGRFRPRRPCQRQNHPQFPIETAFMKQRQFSPLILSKIQTVHFQRISTVPRALALRNLASKPRCARIPCLLLVEHGAIPATFKCRTPVSCENAGFSKAKSHCAHLYNTMKCMQLHQYILM